MSTVDAPNVDADAAIEYSRLAARTAEKSLAYEEAAHHLGNAVEALALKICTIVTEPEAWRDYGTMARARFETTFAAQSISRQFKSVVQSHLAGSGDWRVASEMARV